jgi:hypothetical protein
VVERYRVRGEENVLMKVQAADTDELTDVVDLFFELGQIAMSIVQRAPYLSAASLCCTMVDGPQGSANLHLHTRACAGRKTIAALVEYVETRTDVDVIAITDHDDVASEVRAREAAARRGQRVQVIPGVEISTRRVICSASMSRNDRRRTGRMCTLRSGSCDVVVFASLLIRSLV